MKFVLDSAFINLEIYSENCFKNRLFNKDNLDLRKYIFVSKFSLFTEIMTSFSENDNEKHGMT